MTPPPPRHQPGWIALAWIILAGSVQGQAPAPEPVPVIDAATIHGKVLCGYQGWFRTPGDPSGLGFVHWSRDARALTPRSLSVEMWPDLTEFPPDETHAVRRVHPPRRPARPPLHLGQRRDGPPPLRLDAAIRDRRRLAPAVRRRPARWATGEPVAVAAPRARPRPARRRGVGPRLGAHLRPVGDAARPGLRGRRRRVAAVGHLGSHREPPLSPRTGQNPSSRSSAFTTVGRTTG